MKGTIQTQVEMQREHLIRALEATGKMEVLLPSELRFRAAIMRGILAAFHLSEKKPGPVTGPTGYTGSQGTIKGPKSPKTKH